MDNISKIGTAIQTTGYNPFSLKGTDNNSIKMFAAENGISVDEATKIIEEAKNKVAKTEQLSQEYSAMLDIINSQDEEEEIIITEDFDFDAFLAEESPEIKMQNILNQQKFAMNNNMNDNPDKNNQSQRTNDNTNPFLQKNPFFN